MPSGDVLASDPATAPATGPTAADPTSDVAAGTPVLELPSFVLPADLLIELVPPAAPEADGSDTRIAPAEPAIEPTPAVEPPAATPAAPVPARAAPAADAPSHPAAPADAADEPDAVPVRAERADSPDRPESGTRETASATTTGPAERSRAEPSPTPQPDPVPVREARPAPEMTTPAVKPAEHGAAAAIETRLTIDQIPIRIAHAATHNEHRITIRLDPPDLGRIDVTLDAQGDLVRIAMAVERPETLDLLRRDSQALDQALARSNLRLDGGLEFSLRQDGQRFGGEPRGSGEGRHQPYASVSARAEAAEESTAPAVRPVQRSGDGSIDIIV
ncbi:flagellar hook-length control protein FliK [Benzoatithermus flavus]|uniref:Flagellar hook-length control protein FliK n=1 Tax=Benzoatithermus flavus TaxID=3108223 RepID=A0ABU8XUU3_9PROT